MTTELIPMNNGEMKRSKETKVIDETEQNMLVVAPDGSYKNVPLTYKNKLIYKERLWGLFEAQEEILQYKDCTIIPLGDDTYRLDALGDTVIYGPDEVSKLIENLAKCYRENTDKYIKEMYRNTVANRVRHFVIDYLSEESPFKDLIEAGDIEVTKRGWVVMNNLLITWECNTRLSRQDQYNRRGDRLKGANNTALDLGKPPQEDSNENNLPVLEIDGNNVEITTKERHFVSLILWCLENLR